MKSAAHFLTALSLVPRDDEGLLFDNAPRRSDMLQLMFKEAFLDRSGVHGPELHETWFVKSNAAPIQDVWRSCVKTICLEGGEDCIELELVAHLPSDGLVERRYAQAWSRLLINSRWLGVAGVPRVERHVHYGEVRTCERSVDGTTVISKKEVSRHPIEVPTNSRTPHRVALHASTEHPAMTDFDIKKRDTVRYKCTHEVVSDAWTLTLICECITNIMPTTAAELPAIKDVERVLTASDVEFGACLCSLRSDAALAATVLGIDIGTARTGWRVELEFKMPLPACSVVHQGTAVGLAVFSALMKGIELASRPLAASFMSVAILRRGDSDKCVVGDVLVDRARVIAESLCGAAESLSSVRRPRELTADTLPETTAMAVTPKDDGAECTLFVVPGGLAWHSAGAWSSLRINGVGAPLSPAVLSVEHMPHLNMFVVNDVWVLPKQQDIWQCADLMKRVNAYTSYVGLLAASLDGVRVWAKPWFYTPSDDRADLAAAIDLILDEYPTMGIAADGLVFCSLRENVRGRTTYKFKPLLTLDCLVGTQQTLSVATPEAPVELTDIVVKDLPKDVVNTVAEFAVGPGRALSFKRTRPDKTRPNSMKAADEMFAADDAFRPHRGGLDLMLRLRNGARRFRYVTNAAKRSVVEACRGFRLFVDIGIGADVGKYATVAPAKIIGLDISASKLAAAQQRREQNPHQDGNVFHFVKGDMNDRAVQSKILQHTASDPVVVVSNWTIGYMGRGDCRAFIKDFVVEAIGDRGRLVGIAHFAFPVPAVTVTSGPLVFSEGDGELCPLTALCDLAVGTCWTCTVPPKAIERHWPSEESDNKTFVYWKPTPFLVIGRCAQRGMLQQWILLDASAPNFLNCEYAVAVDDLVAACADAGLELHVRDVDGITPSATVFRASKPHISVTPIESAPGLWCPVPPFRRSSVLTGVVVVEPVVVPCAGHVVWTLWITKRRVALLFHPDGRRFRVHGLHCNTPPCIARVFFNEGKLVAFDILQLCGTWCSEEPYVAVRHPLLAASLSQWLCVADVCAWDDTERLAEKNANSVGRMYLAANRRACVAPVAMITAKRRGDLVYTFDGRCIKEPDRAVSSLTPLSRTKEDAKLIREMVDIDRQVPGGVMDSVNVVGHFSAAMKRLVSQWARVCCCRHEPVFDDRHSKRQVRALLRPRPQWTPPPIQPPHPVSALMPLQPGVVQPWVGQWDRIGGRIEDVSDAVIVYPWEREKLMTTGDGKRRRVVVLCIGYNYFEELLDTENKCL